MKIKDLKQDKRNYRIHNKRNLDLIKKSVDEVGFGRSIVIDNENEIICGNGITSTLDENVPIKVVETDGSELVVVKRTDLATDDDKRKQLAIMDNSTSDSSEFDINLLQEDFEIDELQDLGLELTSLEDCEVDMPDLDSYKKVSLKDKFIIPPFSVFDTKQDYWQKRKKCWLEKTGNLSESKENVLSASKSLLSTINEGSSNFDPVLAEIIMRWFNVKNGKILDPFGGEQTKGVVAGELNMPYFACEFRQEQVDININKTKQYSNINYYCGDSNKIENIIQERNFDLCFTSPPYYDLEIYSKDDMSALGTYGEFMQQYRNIFKQCYNMLADNRFLVIKIGEIRNKKTGEYRNFLGDNIQLFKDIGFKYYNEITLISPCGTAPQRANKLFTTRKLCKLHQNVLVFFKGDLKNIKEFYEPIDIKDLVIQNDY